MNYFNISAKGNTFIKVLVFSEQKVGEKFNNYQFFSRLGNIEIITYKTFSFSADNNWKKLRKL